MSLADVPNGMALPQTAQMKLKPSAVPAVRKRLNIQPYTAPSSTSSISSSELIQFYVPARRNTMYDPQTMYIKGKISAVTGGVAGNRWLNRNAFSIIQRLQVYGQDSTLLEDVQNYNDLVHTLTDIQMGVGDKYALSSMYGGSDNPFTYTVKIPAGSATAQLPDTTSLAGALTNIAGDGENVGATVGAAKVQFGVDIDVGDINLTNVADVDCDITATSLIDKGYNIQGNSITFCLPVVSAFGLLADTLVPIGWLNSDLRFDFYTEVPNRAFRNTDPSAITGYTLSSLELVVDTIEFDPSAMAMVNQYAPVNSPLYCHATTWKTYSSTLSTGQGGSFNSQLIPHRSLSVKQLLVSSHPVDNTDGYDSFSRCHQYGSTDYGLQLSIGGLKYPQKAIKEYSEAFAELQKSQHAFNQLILNGSISRTEYNKYGADVTAVGEELSCKSALGFDLEIYDKKGSTIVNGQNWTGLNVFIEGNVSDDATNATALTHDIVTHYFVNYDCIYVISDGIISVRF